MSRLAGYGGKKLLLRIHVLVSFSSYLHWQQGHHVG